AASHLQAWSTTATCKGGRPRPLAGVVGHGYSLYKGGQPWPCPYRGGRLWPATAMAPCRGSRPWPAHKGQPPRPGLSPTKEAAH
ncbi:hypothetical protein BHM03_00053707, partial [Ensete ventricosum]